MAQQVNTKPAAAPPKPDPQAIAVFEKRMQKLASQIMFHHGFFAPAHMKLAGHRFIVDNTHHIPTAGVNGKSMWLNAEWFATLSDGEALYVILHEYLHCMLLHPLRRGARNGGVWNIAADAIINELLDRYQRERNSEFAKLIRPKIGVDLPKYADWDVISAYNDLLKDCEQEDGDGDGDGGKGGKGGKVRIKLGGGEQALDDCMSPPKDGDGESKDGGEGKTREEQLDELGRDWTDVLIEAAQVAKMQGKLPGCFASLVETFLKPPRHWYEQLMQYFTERCPDESTWSKLNRRFLGNGTYLPGLDGVTIGRLVIGVDSSGSVSQEEFSIIGGALNDVFDNVKPETVVVAQWSTRICDVKEYTPDDLPIETIKRMDHGGTDCGCFFDWVDTQERDAEIVVVLTDGEIGEVRPPNNGAQVLWLVTTPNFNPGFGHVIHCPVA